MRYPRRSLKVAVVVSSVLLGLGFISYRSGAFNGLWKSTTPADLSGARIPEKSGTEDETSNSETAASEGWPSKATESERTIMSGSKSIKLSTSDYTVGIDSYKPPTEARPPATPEPPPPKATERERTLLPGSKAPYPVILEPKP
jgi:hypothetical protein